MFVEKVSFKLNLYISFEMSHYWKYDEFIVILQGMD